MYININRILGTDTYRIVCEEGSRRHSYDSLTRMHEEDFNGLTLEEADALILARGGERHSETPVYRI